MATIKAQLKLTSSTVGSDKLSVLLSHSIAVDPGGAWTGIGRATVDLVTPTTLGSGTARRLVYFKNLDTTNFIKIQTAGPIVTQQIEPGEFVLFFANAGVTTEALADTAPCIAEVAFWDLP